ncbi:uncharacterized protein CLAFUR5_09239 [Fulvia fulva]|uniref:Uncharacterized protein n=1 Tax=Passalora fulva TaxID=5499 RepID=A0A9Q8PGQ1_PASFU|nr:uncharacterized protein CLAFUR5_09239 [Fulvia fulva]UJO22185.1 hypothetical protein CLAFUR5_09239 [Fulvia fulva]
MFVITKLLALGLVLASTHSVHGKLLCFYNERGCNPCGYALCCNGEMKPGDCCGIDNSNWCKDMSGEDLPLTTLVNFYSTDKAVNIIRTSTPRPDGSRCLSTGRPASIEPPAQCSIQYGEVDRSDGTNALGQPGFLGRRVDGESSKEKRCWPPNHVRWTTSEGVTMLGHINEKHGKSGLQKVMMVLNSEGGQQLTDEARRMYDGGEKDPKADLLDSACRYGDVMDQPVHQEEFESEGTALQEID